MPTNTFTRTALVYLAITFPTAYIWHLVAFPAFYVRIGYFGEIEPNIALGFVTIAAQGLLLGYAYPFFQRGGAALAEAMRVSFLFGAIIASAQLLGAAAKHHAPATSEWFLFEGLYFGAQFGLIGIGLFLAHHPAVRSRGSESSVQPAAD